MNENKSIKVNAILGGIKQGMTVLFPLITFPYVSRVLGNDNIGKINFGSSLIAYATLIAGLGISTYAVLEGAKRRDDRQELRKFTDEVFTINIITTLIAYLLLFGTVAASETLRPYAGLILIQSVPMLFNALGVEWMTTLFEDFFYITVRYIAIQLLALIAMFLFVRTADDYLIYAGITSGALVLGNAVNLLYIRKKYFAPRLTRHFRPGKHLKPMLVLLANNLAISIYVNSDITLLTLFKGDAVTGDYSVGVKIYTILKQVVAAVISVTLPRLSYYLGKGMREEYRSLLRKVLHAVLLLALPMMTGIFMLSREIILLIAGEQFLAGHTALRILSAALVFAVISNYYVYAILIPNRMENFVLLTTVLAAVLNVAANFVLIPLIGADGAACTTVAAEAAVLILSVAKSAGTVKIGMRFRQLLPCIVGSALIAAVCAGVQTALNGVFAVIALSVLGSAAVYGAALLVLRDEIAWSLLSSLAARLKAGKRG